MMLIAFQLCDLAKRGGQAWSPRGMMCPGILHHSHHYHCGLISILSYFQEDVERSRLHSCCVNWERLGPGALAPHSGWLSCQCILMALQAQMMLCWNVIRDQYTLDNTWYLNSSTRRHCTEEGRLTSESLWDCCSSLQLLCSELWNQSSVSHTPVLRPTGTLGERLFQNINTVPSIQRFQSFQTLCSSPWCYIPCEFQASNKHRCSIIYAYAWFSILNQSPLKNIFIQISKPLLLEGPISGSGMGHRICISNKYKEKN